MVRAELSEEPSALIVRGVSEVLGDRSAELNHLARDAATFFDLGGRGSDRVSQSLEFVLQDGLAVRVLQLVYDALDDKICEAREAPLRRGELVLGACRHLVDAFPALGIPPFDGLQRPAEERLGESDPIEKRLDVGGDLLFPRRRRSTRCPVNVVLTLMAAVVGVVAGTPSAILSNQTAVSTVTAAEKAGIDEGIATRSRLAAAGEELLHPCELVGRDHWRVFAPVLLVAARDRARVEAVAQQEVDGLDWDGAGYGVLRRARFEASFNRAAPGFGHGHCSARHVSPKSAHQFESLGIGDHGCRATPKGCIALFHVADGWNACDSTALVYGTVAALHPLREIVGHLGRRSEQNLKHEFRIASSGVDRFVRDNLAKQPFAEVVSEGAAIDRVAGETIEAPANETVHLTRLDLAKQSREHGPAGFAGRAVFGALVCDRHTPSVGNSPKFAQLSRDGEYLHILAVGGLAGVEDVPTDAWRCGWLHIQGLKNLAYFISSVPRFVKSDSPSICGYLAP